MLQSLFIQNFALIDEIEVKFDAHFNIITGETGAGKSILLGALGLVLGERLEVAKLKNKAKNTVIEAVFLLRNSQDEVVIRRVINPAGKSRVFYNDEPIKLEDLKKKATSLIDVHSQHKNLLLGDSSFQLDFIDHLAGTELLLNDYQALFADHKLQQTKLAHISAEFEKENEQKEFYLHQLSKFEALNLGDDFNELELELERLNNIEGLKTKLYESESLLGGETEQDVLSLLGTTQKKLNDLGVENSNITNIRENLNQAEIAINSALEEISSFNESLVPDGERQAELQNTVSVLYELIEVFRVPNIADLFVKKQELEAKVLDLDNFSAEIFRLENLLKNQELDLVNIGEKLTKKREAVFGKLEAQIITEIRELGMEKAVFSIRNEQKNALSETGLDKIKFYFSAHEKNELSPVEKSTSGGEAARIMFVIKNILAAHKSLPTIIFDEVDTGISGKVAEKMGEKMQKMSESTQIITITHLPQIASKSAKHFFVQKINDGQHSDIKVLNAVERVEEIANMLSSDKITDLSLKNARELLGD